MFLPDPLSISPFRIQGALSSSQACEQLALSSSAQSGCRWDMFRLMFQTFSALLSDDMNGIC